eukprot:gene17446-35922_t
MTGMSEKYRQMVSTVTMSIPHIRLISTVTGKEVRDEMMQTQYWIDHILCRVQYHQAIQCAWESGIRVYVEMGPSNTLSQLCRGCIKDQDDHELLEIVSGLDKSSTRKSVKRYVPPDRPHRMLQRVKRDDFEQRTIFTTYLHSGILKDWLRDHKLFGTVVVPGAALLEMSLSAAKKTCHSWSQSEPAVIIVSGVSFIRPMIALDVAKPGDRTACVRCVIDVDGNVGFYGEDEDGSRIPYAMASTSCSTSNILHPSPHIIDMNGVEWSRDIDVNDLYRYANNMGLSLGVTFRLIRELKTSDDGMWTMGILNTTCSSFVKSTYLIPPTILDAVFQVSMGAGGSSIEGVRLRVPSSIDSLSIRDDAWDLLTVSDHCIVHVRIRDVSDSMMTVFDCHLTTSDGMLVLVGSGMRLRVIGVEDVAPNHAVDMKRDTLELVSQWRHSKISPNNSPLQL